MYVYVYTFIFCVCATHQPSGTSSTSKRLNLLCDCDTVHLSLGEDVYLFNLLKNARGYFITRGVLIIIYVATYIIYLYLLSQTHTEISVYPPNRSETQCVTYNKERIIFYRPNPYPPPPPPPPPLRFPYPPPLVSRSNSSRMQSP